MVDPGLDVLALRQLLGLRRSGREAVEALSLVQEGLPEGSLREALGRARRRLSGEGGPPLKGLAGQLASATPRLDLLETVTQAAETRWETRAALRETRRLLALSLGGTLCVLTALAFAVPTGLLDASTVPPVVEFVLGGLRRFGVFAVIAALVVARKLPIARVPGGAELDRAARLLEAAHEPRTLALALDAEDRAVIAAAPDPAAGVRHLAEASAVEGRRRQARFVAAAPTLALGIMVFIAGPTALLILRSLSGLFTP